MTITYDNRKVVISSSTEKAVARSASRIAEFILSTPFLVALILLVVVGTLYVLVTYPVILWAKSKAIRQIDCLIRDVSKIKQRDAMILHANFSELRWQSERMVEKVKAFFVFRPLLQQFTVMSAAYKRAEEALACIAYPQKHELDSEQSKKLVEIFKNWEEDWADEKMDIYNDN